ncbi:Uncharacterised protein [Vibrio cholerae]|nr:Uncharacterised protein [Vibrio cholerae]
MARLWSSVLPLCLLYTNRTLLFVPYISSVARFSVLLKYLPLNLSFT